MIRGQVANKRPYVLAQVSVPRLGRKAFILFMIDTGSDVTIVHPRDLRWLNISFADDLQAGMSARVDSIGGGAAVITEPSELMLVHTDGTTDSLPLQLHFAQPGTIGRRYPSLLGQDVLANYRFTYEPSSWLATLEYPQGPDLGY